MNRFYASGILPTLGGTCALMTVMGIGRFAYTALLPGMMHGYGFGEDVAGVMAAWNYAGYLLGVLAMRGARPGLRRYVMFVCFLALSLITTAGMALVTAPFWWHIIRFFSGFASGVCFVLCSSIVLDTLAAIDRPVLAGFLYSGVGAGIALGGFAAGPLEAAYGSLGAWPGMAALCLPLAAVACTALRPGVNRTLALQTSAKKIKAAGQKEKQGKAYALLLAAYFLEGFGYIIGATFLVALVQKTTNSPEAARTAWIVTGCAAALSAPLWRYAARKGYCKMLILAFVLQGIGALIPVASDSVIAALSGGLLLGGTFMGIVVLSLQYGVCLSGGSSAHTVAIMTGVYGVGQIIGPFIAGFTARGQGLAPAFILSSVSLFIAVGFLLAGGKTR